MGANENDETKEAKPRFRKALSADEDPGQRPPDQSAPEEPAQAPIEHHEQQPQSPPDDE